MRADVRNVAASEPKAQSKGDRECGEEDKGEAGGSHVVEVQSMLLDGMDAWNKSTHGKSGLIDKVKASLFDEAAVESEALAFLREYVPPKISPMCGNSICQDRRFLARWMPVLESYFLYRNLDVSTLKELCRRWKPDVARGWIKQGKHEALADIYESIDELKYYRDTFIRR